MKTAVVTKDKKVSVEEKQLRPLKHGEALVQTEYCGVCHTDLHVKNADFGDVTGCGLFCNLCKCNNLQGRKRITHPSRSMDGIFGVGGLGNLAVQ